MLADGIEPEELRRLLYYLIDSVLERPAEPGPAAIVPHIVAAFPSRPT
jgi:hypothetical protein